MDVEFEGRIKDWEEQLEIDNNRRRSKLDEYFEISKTLDEVEITERYTVKTGYTKFDDATGGFESRRTYLVGGLSKSGKSTLLMNFMSNMLISGEKIGVIDTELDREDYITRLVAISNYIHEDDVTTDMQKSFEDVYLKTDAFKYCSELDVLENGVYDAERIMITFEKWRMKGTRVFVIDNITTIQNQLVGNRAGYELLRDFLGKIIRYAKTKNIVLLLVLHTKDSDLIGKENLDKLSKIINDKEPHRMFESSVKVNYRPSSSDLYGGAGIRSQISGGVLLLWRPFQDYNDREFQKVALLILEDWRSKRKTFINEIELEFDIHTSHYNEVSDLEFQARKEFDED